MRVCSSCGHNNVASASRCVGCSRPLPKGASSPPVLKPQVMSCPACGSSVGPSHRHCPGCGLPVGKSSPSSRPGPGPVLARLVVLAADGSAIQTVGIGHEGIEAGSKAQLSFADAFVAPVHARFSHRNGQIWITPANTVNGVFTLVKEDVELLPGSEIRIGRQLLTVMPAPEPPESAEPIWGSKHPDFSFRLVQILQGGIEGDSFPLKDGDSLIGRAGGDLSFPNDGYVSGRHAVVTVNKGRITLRDIGSSNGTFVRLKKESPLEYGDLLLMGEQLLRLDPP